MAQVPAGSSGIGSGLFNACRQIGTATGLAILGSVGSTVILADWYRHARYLVPVERQRAVAVGADIAGGQVRVAAALVHGHTLDRAVASFLTGFEVTLLLAGAILIASGVVGVVGLQRHMRTTAEQRPMTDTSINR